MAKIRVIPFGYSMRNGQIVLHPAEAPAVRQIFSDFLAGLTMNQIISRLTVPYSEHATWNRFSILRVLDSSNYIGNLAFPPIIDNATYQTAAEKRKASSARYGNQSPELREMRSKLYCKECGQKLTRCIIQKAEHYNCKNAECSRFPFFLTNEMLIAGVLQLLNTAIANPNMLHAEPQAAYQPTTEVYRQQNEISRLMENPQTDTNQIKTALYQLAQMQYEACTCSDAPQKTAMLRQILARKSRMETLDIDLLKQAVTRITVSHTGDIAAELLGGTVLTAALGGESPC